MIFCKKIYENGEMQIFTEDFQEMYYNTNETIIEVYDDAVDFFHQFGDG
jgi:hypothetical protein